MTERGYETVGESGYGRDISAAQAMTDWFPEYLYGVIDAPGELPRLTVERLLRQFGSGDPTQHLERIRDALMIFDEAHQSNLASYFCGYPDEALKALEEGMAIEQSIQAMDELFPPISIEQQKTMLLALRQEREARAIKRRQEALARRAVLPASIPVVREVSGVLFTDGDTPSRYRTTAVPSFAASTVEPGHPLEWQTDAVCAQVDPELFFPEKGGSTRPAKRICDSCEVKAECLDYAMQGDERFGIWGGLSERERRKYKKSGELPPRYTQVVQPETARKEKPLRIEPFQRQIKRTEHFVRLIAGTLDPELFDMYNDHPEHMARVAYALLHDVYPDKDSQESFDRVRRLDTYFLHKKWNRYQDDFGGHGKYWDLLTADLSDVFSRTKQLREEYESSEPLMPFAEHYFERGMEHIQTEGAAPTFTLVHVLRKPKSQSETDYAVDTDELLEAHSR